MDKSPEVIISNESGFENNDGSTEYLRVSLSMWIAMLGRRAVLELRLWIWQTTLPWVFRDGPHMIKKKIKQKKNEFWCVCVKVKVKMYRSEVDLGGYAEKGRTVVCMWKVNVDLWIYK